MANCLKWVCVFVISAFTIAFMYVPKSNGSSLEDTKKTISALTTLNCQGKFNDSNKYYAVCPNDTFIEISHLEYNLFKVDVKEVPATYKKTNLDSSFTLADFLSLLMAGLIAGAGFSYLKSLFFGS